MGLKPRGKNVSSEDTDSETTSIEMAPEAMGVVQIINRKGFMTAPVRIPNF